MAKVELKQPIVEEISNSIKDAQSVVLVNYSGLTVEQDTILRKELREAGVQYKVYKNTMMRRAFEGTAFESLSDHLHGTNAIAISETDATAPARILAKYAKQFPALELIAVIPYRKRLDSLNKKTRTRELLEACADVVVIQEKYLPSVYSHRNRYMVEHSDRVIAVYDGRETGGTAKTIRFTHRMKKELREIPVGEIVLPDHLKPKTK